MELVLEVVVLGRAARNITNIKNRQPIADMYVNAPSTLPEFFIDIIEDELNIKNVEFTDNMDKFINYNIKPNFRVLGKKVGKAMSEIKNLLTTIDAKRSKTALDKSGELKLKLQSGEEITLTNEDIEITMTQAEGFNCQQSGEVTITLSTRLTSELIEEGFVREIISKLQTMRRDSGFEVMDRIIVYAGDNDKLVDIMRRNEEEIKRIVLANEIKYNEESGSAKVWNINGENINLAVIKV